MPSLTKKQMTQVKERITHFNTLKKENKLNRKGELMKIKREFNELEIK